MGSSRGQGYSLLSELYSLLLETIPWFWKHDLFLSYIQSDITN